MIYASGVSYAEGGYIRVGNIIIINMKLNISSSVPQGRIIVSGFPKTATGGMVLVDNNTSYISYITNSGYIYCYGSLSANSVWYVSSVYIAS